MAKTVRVIPATPRVFRSEVAAEPRRRRTAGYARVSTDHEEQASSYEMQMAHYKNYIESRADWDFVGMYSDEGISGTNTKKRDGFNQMIEDALAGKIDLIITKSVSRFARNTVDSLQNVRKLKEHGVEIYFEKENIWTFDTRGDVLRSDLIQCNDGVHDTAAPRQSFLLPETRWRRSGRGHTLLTMNTLLTIVFAIVKRVFIVNRISS